jgi:hypothetical protein
MDRQKRELREEKREIKRAGKKRLILGMNPGPKTSLEGA